MAAGENALQEGCEEAELGKRKKGWRGGKNRERLPPFSALQKGQRLLASYREPQPRRPLPVDCFRHAVLHYDRRQIDLVTAVGRDLLCLPDRGRGWMRELEAYWLSEEDKRQSPPGKVHSRVRACSSVCDAYERLIREVVGPDLLSRFNAACGGSTAAEGAEEEERSGERQSESEPETVLLYQFPPTLRIFCSALATGSSLAEDAAEGAEGAGEQAVAAEKEGGGRASPSRAPAPTEEEAPRYKSLGRLHNDAQYGHQPGEVNFWLPLTRLSAASTLWAESAEGRGDFQPLLLRELSLPADALDEAGQELPGVDEPQLLPVQRFHGTLCRHHTQPNSSGRTRVSLDFRCAPRAAFDAEWKLPGIVHRHEMREMRFDAHLVARGSAP